MRQYTLGKKAAMVVIHQLFSLLMITGVFTMDAFIRSGQPDSGMLFGMLSIVGLAGMFIALACLTNVCGKQEESDPNITFLLIDKIPAEILVVLFVFVAWFFVRMTARLKMMDFALAGLLITAGTLGYIADLIFLAFYLSIVRRVKGNVLYNGSIFSHAVSFFGRLYNKQRRENEWFLTRKQREQRQIQRAIEAIAAGALDTKLEVEQFHGQQRELAEAVNNIGSGMSEAVAERIRNERMKADLITNVSHDIKTPLTSIVNYVDLLKRENLENENARNYIRILDEKSQRLKQLTEDLVEASKISSGNIRLDMQRIDFVELLYQIGGEFNERFEQRELTIVTKLPHAPVMVYADGRQMYRAIENLYTNAAKYALEKTRVYVELTTADAKAVFTIRNISKNPLSGTLVDGGNELTERFVRGESSRTTEGSGLGLSIAKNLTQLMGGTFAIQAEDDLFIVTISFDVVY
jgi:signal transduction histidine kinase